ncbi:MAG: hypothetical protein R3Y12_01790 [Clostridia bacterium]
MNNIEKLYQTFFIPSEQKLLHNNIEKLRAELKESIGNEDRKKVLRIIDDYGLVKEQHLRESFTAGLKLGLEIKEELKNYHHTEENHED